MTDIVEVDAMRWRIREGLSSKGPYTAAMVSGMYDAGHLDGCSMVRDGKGPWLRFADHAAFDAHAAGAVEARVAPLAPGVASGLGGLAGCALSAVAFPILMLAGTGLPVAAGACALLVAGGALAGSVATATDGEAVAVAAARVPLPAAAVRGAPTAMFLGLVVASVAAFLSGDGLPTERYSFVPRIRYVSDCYDAGNAACVGKFFVLQGKVTAQDGDVVRVMGDGHGWDVRTKVHLDRDYVGRTVRFDGTLTGYHLVHDDMVDGAVLKVLDPVGP